MRRTFTALAVTAGLFGFGAAAQAAPLSAAMPVGASADTNIVHVQMTPMEHHMMRRHMEHRMMRRHMEHRMMRRHMEHRMMRRHMRHMMHHDM